MEPNKHQKELEECIHALGMRRFPQTINNSDAKSMQSLIRAGADPFAFPEHILSKEHPVGFEASFFQKCKAQGSSSPGEVSLAGWILWGPSRIAEEVLPFMMKSRKFSSPPQILRGSQSMDILQAMSDPSLFLRWSKAFNTDKGQDLFRSVVRAMPSGSDLVGHRLCEMALNALAAGSMEIGPKEEHKSMNQSLGFHVFADLILAGVSLPASSMAGYFMTYNKMTPLLSSALYFKSSRRDELIQRLLDLGSPVNAASLEHRQTPLMHAAEFADLRGMQILVDAGADLFARDSRGWTFRSFAKNHAKNSPQASKEALALCDSIIANEMIRKSMAMAPIVSPARGI